MSLAEEKSAHEPEAFAAAAERILASPQFARAETQRRLLQYLWENRHRTLNEYAIATEALGRSADFDPGTDASIRVHMSRLRQKLKAYYAETGEPEVLLLPLGVHGLHLREPRAPVALEPVLPALPAVAAPTALELADPTELPQVLLPEARVLRPSVAWRSYPVALLGMLSAALAIALVLVVDRQERTAAAASHGSDRPNEFWSALLAGDAPVRILLPTPTFFGFPAHPALRLRSTAVNGFDRGAHDPEFEGIAGKLGPMELDQSYTVTWDTLAAVQIVRYLDRVGQDKRVAVEVTRDTSLLSLEEANVIALGTSKTLEPLRAYLNSLSFRMQSDDNSIVNTAPRDGEPASFLREHQGRERHVELAVVALLPGRAPGLNLLLLESGDTGCLIPLLTSSAGANAFQELWHQHGEPPFYEMVVQTELEGHTPLRSRPVAMHPYTQKAPGSDAP